MQLSSLFTNKVTIMIEHEGVITRISNNIVSVKILQRSACSDCHAKGACMAADSKEKIIEVVDNSGDFKVNDLVVIEGKKSIGYKAILWAFVLPIVLILSTLSIVTSVFMWNETKAALTSFVVLVPYYAILYLFRHKMANSLRFTIKTKIDILNI